MRITTEVCIKSPGQEGFLSEKESIIPGPRETACMDLRDFTPRRWHLGFFKDSFNVLLR